MQHIYMMDSKGLITTKRGDKLPKHKQLMAHGDDVPVIKDLKDVIAHVKPHALIGLTGAGPAFKKVSQFRQPHMPVKHRLHEWCTVAPMSFFVVCQVNRFAGIILEFLDNRGVQCTWRAACCMNSLRNISTAAPVHGRR